ncbi:MAG: Ig-like domain-containing protein [Terriglobales bacterium]
MRAAAVTAYTFPSISPRFSRILMVALVVVSASLCLFAQDVTVTPASLTFANEAVGFTSAAKTVTINNAASSPEPVSIVPSDGFTETDTCGGNIAANSSCKMSVYFAPTTVGKITGTVSVNDNTDYTLASVAVSGTGVTPTTFTPATLAFGSQAVGTTSAAKTATLKNNQPTALTISSITISGGPAPGDYAPGGTCPTSGTLAAGKTCTITVTLTPSSAGSRPATLTVSDSASTSPQTVALTGTGVVPVTLSPATLSFGTAYEGNVTAAKSVTLTNSQKTALNFSSIAASGDFAISSNTCGSSVAASAKCVVGVTFSPTATGVRTGALTFTDSASTSPQSISLSGTGSAPLTVSPASLTFASRGVGSTSAADTVTMTNHLATSMSFSSIVAGGDFAVVNNNCGSGVAAGQKCTVGVTFTPSIVGKESGALTINYSGFGSPITLNLTGTGSVSGLSSITVTPVTPTIAKGTNQQFAATGYFTNGSSTDLTNTVVWSSSTQTVATINTTGLANGAGAGSSTITATSGSIKGTTLLTVSAGPTYTIGGTVSGLSGNGLVLQDNGGNNLTVNSGATAFTFSQAIASGSPYSVTVLTQPSSPTQTCLVTNGSGTVGSANVTNVQINCTTNTYTIGGSISGYSGSGLVLQDNGGNNLTVNSGATGFTFSTPIASGSTYSVTVLTQPSGPAQTCTVTSGGGTVGSANVTNVQVNCAAVTYTIGGTISGYSGSGLVLLDNGGNNLTVSSGATGFTFSTPIASGSTYTVTVGTQPSNPTQTCLVTNGSGTATANVTNVQIACTTNTYTIGGTISGYTGSGLVLQDNGGDNLTVTSGSTGFTFATKIASSSTYSVTVLTQPSGPAQTCSVTSGSGTVTNANITNVQVTCSAVTYTIGGTISGYTGSGLVLQDNGGNNLTVTSGATAFTFSQAIASGSPYSVTVLTQPSNPAQTCLVTNGSGNATSNVTNVVIACTTNTYTIGGSISGYSGSGLVLQDNGGNNLTVASGATAFTFTTPIASGSTYAVTVLTQPSSPTETCVVTNGSGTVSTANITNVQIACSTQSYTVGGTIAGYSGSGLVLQDNGGNNLTVTSGATGFTFSQAIPGGTTYSVTVLTQPSGPAQTCLVTNGSGTANANVTNVQIACTTTTYTIGGSISGYSGSGLVLQDNGGNNLSVTSGATSFTFSQAINAGSTYNVTVLTQPSSPSENCTVTNGSGTGNANVTNVQVTCSAIVVSATLTPASAHQGSSQVIIIAGTGTSFGPTTTVNFGADITAGTLTVNGPTSASVPITLDNVAATGSRTVTITTGAQQVNVSFSVLAGVPAVTLINPNTIQPTQSESVTITGAFTNWTSATKANFGPGIAVGGAAPGAFGPVTFNSATSLTANLVTSGASIQLNAVQIQTGSQTLTVNNGISIQTCNTTTPGVVSISPNNLATTVPLNAQVQVQFNEPMDRTSFLLGNSGSATVFFYDTVSNLEVPGTISLDASSTIATITPSVALPAGRMFIVSLSSASSLQDTCANTLAPQQFTFTTAFSNDLTGPALTGSSPVSGDSGVPTNAPIVLQFNDQLDPITAQNGFSVTQNGSPLSGTFSYSVDDKTVTFTPNTFLIPSATYTVSYTAQITDTVGNALTNPGSFSFTAGATSITTPPSVTAVNPPSQSLGVGLNIKPRVTFSTAVNGLTIPAAVSLTYAGGPIVPATVTVATNRLSATITPSSQLLPNTQYAVNVCGYTDIAGNTGNCLSSTFVTGTSAITSHVTVSSISPPNGQTSAPLNAEIVAVMSNTIDPTTLTSSSITLTPANKSSVAGTLSLGSDGVTLTFTPGIALTGNTVYTVVVSGFSDAEGNTVTSFTSTFTPGAGSYGASSFKLSSTTPANKATGVAVTSQVVFTMSNLVDAASVNAQTAAVEICFDGAACSASESVAGTYSVSGAAITFTPLTPYPANTVMGMEVNGLLDEAGNSSPDGFKYFTTTSTADTTPPTVTVTPANGATNVGLNTQIVVSFSESINISTITSSSLTVFNGDTAANYNYTISADNRTIVLTPGGSAWTSGAVITVALSNAIQDLSGNALANTSSQFTLTTAASGTVPTVASMRPGNGSTNVSANTAITLFTSMAMNASTITGALDVTDNGVVVSGTVQLFSNGQAIEFTPSSPFNAGDLIQVFLGSSALGADGSALNSFSGQFTVAGSSSTAAQVVAMNPFPGATSVPLNTVIQVEYNQPLLSGSVSCNGGSGSVTLYNGSTYLTPNCTVSGQVISISPTSNLTADQTYTVAVTGSVTNTSGTPVQASSFTFTAGTTVDNAAPTIVSQAPTNNATNIGTNARVTMNFNKAINPISVTGSTIQLSGGGVTETPSSISFSPDYTRVRIIPQAPMPPSTAMTLVVNGVTSQAGTSAATKTTSFTTAAQPDFTTPVVIYSSVVNGQTNVPVNAVLSMQFSKPMDIGSLDPAKVYVMGGVVPTAIAPTTVSWSSDQTTVSLVPTSPLNIGDSYSLCSASMTDLDGNVQTSFCATFTAAFTTNSNGPSVVNTSPESAETQVPTNAPVQVLFSEPIQPTSIGQITFKTGGNAVAASTSFSDANQLLTLTPALPLLINTSYTISITGVKDSAGNQMTGTVTNTFTTAGTFDLAGPSVLLTDPAPDTTGVGTNVIARVQFSERLNPLTVVTSSNEPYNQGSVELLNANTGAPVPITVTMSSDRTTAIVTPTSALSSNTLYTISAGNAANYYDVAGNGGSPYTSNFTTAAGTHTTSTTVSSISPANAQTTVPINAQVVALMSDTIDPTTINNSSITVKTSGGVTVGGTVSLASDGVTLTFAPNGNLAAATSFNVSVGGFNDVQGNPVTTFTSTFTTNSASYSASSFTFVSTTPNNDTSGVAVNTPVMFTMSNLIDAASVNSQTVQVFCTGNPGSPNCANATVAGTYSVSGKSVTFTPLTPYPGGASMVMVLNGLMDLAGNVFAYDQVGSFSTASTNDTTKPTVAITPSNGATNIGLNPQVVLTFSKSIDPQTVSISSVALFNGDVALSPSITISGDNRTVVLSGVTLPPGATITVVASHLITDLSGNALADTTSQFTTSPAALTSSPTVVNSRPGNGATNVATNTVITLFTSAPMNSSTIPGALYVSQNGIAVSGTPTVAANGQSIVFTPSSNFTAGTPIQVFLNSTAQDTYGNSLTNFQATFTTAGSTSSAAVVQAVNPGVNTSNVPLNTTIQVQFNQTLQSGSVSCNGSSGSVTLYNGSTYLTPSCSASGQVITINPTGNLAAGTTYIVGVTSSVTNTSSVAVTPFSYSFTAGSAVDNAAPVIVSVAPPNSSTNIGTNAGVSVNFNKAINPVSVTGSSIQLSGGSVTEVPSSISFTPDYTRVTILPQTPLPANTQMAIAISGVTSVAGTAVASQTTHFTTMAGPDLTAPYVVNSSVAKNQTVGTNAAFAMQFNEAIDPGSVNPAGAQDVYIYDTTASAAVTTNITFSTDLTTVMLTPTSSLNPGDQMAMCSSTMTNLSGIPQQNFCVNFLVGAGPDTTGPSVLEASPPTGATGVGTNTLIQILFSEQLDGASIAGVTLKHGGSTVPTITSLFDGDQGIQMLPLSPLTPNTTYTINVTGVLDITGNPQASFPSQSFTTGSGLDLIAPTIVSINPANGATSVPDNTTIQVVFSEPMDPASFDPTTSFTLQDQNRNAVPGTISFSPDYTTVTLTPNSSLVGGGASYTFFVSYFSPVYDLSGNKCNNSISFFATE